MLQVAFAAEHSAERLQVEHVAFIRAEDQADIGHHQKHGKAEERARAFRHGGVREDQRGQVGAQHAQDRAGGGADQAAQAGVAQAQLEENDGDGRKENRPERPIHLETLNGRKW